MNKTEIHSAGGRATAIIEKEQAKKRIDEYNSNPNKCLFCGGEILHVSENRLTETKKKKFCSRSCAAKYNNARRIRYNNENNTNSNIIQNSLIDNFSDEEIIEMFENSKNLTDFSKKLGYKRKIHTDNKSINNRLKKLGLNLEDLVQSKVSVPDLTKGDLFARTNNWQSARSQIQRYARITYKKSDKSKECIVCGYDKHYEVAHIKAVSEFDDDALISEINNIDNLVALCPNHHWEYDNTDFNIEDYL